MSTLRPYQIRALEELRANWHNRPLLVAPTGAGKTTIAAAIAEGALSKGRTVLFAAHRRELLAQAQERLPWGVSFRSIASRKPVEPADVLIIDEAHRSAAVSYQKLIAAHDWEAVIGLTATPFRLDGRGLDCAFGALVVAATPRELMDAGYLVEPRIFAGRIEPDLSGVAMRGKDYDPGALDEAMAAEGLVADVVENVQRHGGPAVIFASGVRHSKRLVEKLGAGWAHIDGSTPKGERDEILADLKAGHLAGISNVEILTEGWDLPAARVCVLARPTLSLALYLQMIGRVLRPFPGKEAPIVLDHAGNVWTHGPPDAEVRFSLKGKPERPKDAVPSISTCLECYAIFPSGTDVCPQCGAERLSTPRKVKETPGVMIEVDPADIEREWYARKLREASKKGCRVGWARAKFKDRFGQWPKLFDLEEAVYTVQGFPSLDIDGLRAGGLPEGTVRLLRFANWKARADAAVIYRREREQNAWKAKRNLPPPSSPW